MASESDDRLVSVTLSSELRQWLDEKAATLDLDEETLVVQLLATYHAAEELDDNLDPAEFFEQDVDADTVEPAVREVIADRLPDIAEAVADQQDDGGDVGTVEAQLTAELDRVETDFQEKLEDVRKRVVQVKRETDAKAPADHDHEEFARLDEVASDLADLEGAVADLEAQVDDHAAQLDEATDRLDDLSELDERISTAEERLQTVAWIVRDLRDAHEAKTGATRAIDRLKRAAAAADVSRAVCEECEEAVEIGLMTEPNCPHCGTAISDVRPASGLFSKPKLVVAEQLTAGEESESNVPDAADGGTDPTTDPDGDGDRQ